MARTSRHVRRALAKTTPLFFKGVNAQMNTTDVHKNVLKQTHQHHFNIQNPVIGHKNAHFNNRNEVKKCHPKREATDKNRDIEIFSICRFYPLTDCTWRESCINGSTLESFDDAGADEWRKMNLKNN
ncbi:hypothetical protein HELRODRAFT_168614 [Helobdella robusta]|uniref:Uncharacterized protein n=1 Tax=Helobdella robusta TaxID=6412 RepID=T1F0S7_HELRO|nr:hypothetical protein HELRODRAFT_168614 [Helobdella robusta]ESO09605.1 hypothetical protein HELRODRAFT_168614 [Helobdella robusta]